MEHVFRITHHIMRHSRMEMHSEFISEMQIPFWPQPMELPAGPDSPTGKWLAMFTARIRFLMAVYRTVAVRGSTFHCPLSLRVRCDALDEKKGYWEGLGFTSRHSEGSGDDCDENDSERGWWVANVTLWSDWDWEVVEDTVAFYSRDFANGGHRATAALDQIVKHIENHGWPRDIKVGDYDY